MIAIFCSSKARHIMTQVVKGVLYLHSHGIIHRDLTLGNILLTKEMDAVSFNLFPVVQRLDNAI